MYVCVCVCTWTTKGEDERKNVTYSSCVSRRKEIERRRGWETANLETVVAGRRTERESNREEEEEEGEES